MSKKEKSRKIHVSFEVYESPLDKYQREKQEEMEKSIVELVERFFNWFDRKAFKKKNG